MVPRVIHEKLRTLVYEVTEIKKGYIWGKFHLIFLKKNYKK